MTLQIGPQRGLDKSAVDQPGHRRRYAVCGLSVQAIGQYVYPLTGDKQFPEYGDFSRYGQVVGILDIDPDRIHCFNANLGTSFPAYDETQFDRMIAETRPDAVVVAGPDATHAHYIVRALEHHLDVVVEKPMVTDCVQARRVLDAEAKSRGTVRVAHNFRYPRVHIEIKRLIRQGAIGRVTNVELVWNLDTYHGASYFWRWNRDRALSGGLSITKACHHFDLINWWLEDEPEAVFAFGALNYYGKSSPHNPARGAKSPMGVTQQKKQCPYHQRWFGPGRQPPKDDHLIRHEQVFKLPYTKQYNSQEPLYIYDNAVAIEDTYSAVVRYRSGASLAYSLNASAPWEGYRLGINGTHGRIELEHRIERTTGVVPPTHDQIVYYPIFQEPRVIEVTGGKGGHQGADPRIKADIFIGDSEETKELNLKADSREGALAVAVGEAIWRSVAEDRMIGIRELLDLT